MKFKIKFCVFVVFFRKSVRKNGDGEKEKWESTREKSAESKRDIAERGETKRETKKNEERRERRERGCRREWKGCESGEGVCERENESGEGVTEILGRMRERERVGRVCLRV